MNKKKIFNDPVYGFITIPYEIVFDLIEHPYFQRLRRIRQLGLTHYVYPGALHTRFHHTLGALHLMTQAIEVLRSKGVEILPEEAEAVTIAILLHDIGHGPFSHALEHILVNVHHEELSILFMKKLNKEFNGRLSMALEIFENRYPKKFLYQLVSGQLDMDRMDYLNRDSFFTGVSEGVIGYDRIIKMLDVRNDELVVEEKGIYSIEKFLIARRLMYWQVYLHKTVLCAEQMLIKAVKRIKQLLKEKKSVDLGKNLHYFLSESPSLSDFEESEKPLDCFAKLDDFDLIYALKSFYNHDDFVLSFLAKGIIDRKLLKVALRSEPFDSDYVDNVRLKIYNKYKLDKDSVEYLVFNGDESNRAYDIGRDEIKILYKDGSVKPMSKSSDYQLRSTIVKKHYLCYPK